MHAHDYLVKLYDLPHDWGFMQIQNEQGIEIRKPLGPEKHLVLKWIKTHFHDYWVSEAEKAFSNDLTSIYIAICDGKICGFGCYDATALGYFGPLGVGEAARGKKTGQALLSACLLDMKMKGYGYAIIPTHIPKFYQKVVDCILIENSHPGIFKTFLQDPETE